MSSKKKYEILSQAKNHAETILKNNKLNVPFEVSLEKIKEPKTIAIYHVNSSKEGLVNVSYNTHLIGRDIDKVVLYILHEYSHGIFEDVGELFTEDILKMIELLRRNKYGNKYVPFYRINIDVEKEDFCNFWASYLINKKNCVKFNDEIEKICKTIIQDYYKIHTNRIS
jgi:hypothetical protein